MIAIANVIAKAFFSHGEWGNNVNTHRVSAAVLPLTFEYIVMLGNGGRGRFPSVIQVSQCIPMDPI